MHVVDNRHGGLVAVRYCESLPFVVGQVTPYECSQKRFQAQVIFRKHVGIMAILMTRKKLECSILRLFDSEVSSIKLGNRQEHISDRGCQVGTWRQGECCDTRRAVIPGIGVVAGVRG